MTEDYILGNLDLASISLWLFFIFFVALVIYIQRENMREGYPLKNDDGTDAASPGLFPLPEDKTFKLPHGRGEVVLPSQQAPDREDLALERTHPSQGFPFEPTGDPLADGVGPASWVARKDVPELDGHGHPKIVPMSGAEGFFVAAGNDPRGLPVVAADGAIVGKVVDLWVDAPEQLIRYLELELDAGGKRLLPMTLARVWRNQVSVKSLFGEHFAGVPSIASPSQVTKLEEDKISAYYGGGHLYASPKRLAPQI